MRTRLGPARKTNGGSNRAVVVVSGAMTDPELELSDDPSYRAGLLMGRQQSITDVMERLLSKDGKDASAKLISVLEWCVQTQEEGRVELQLVVQALNDQDDEE